MHVDAIVRFTVRFLMKDRTSDERHFNRDLFQLSPLFKAGNNNGLVSIPILNDSPEGQYKSDFFVV